MLTIPGQKDLGASFLKAAFPENDLDLQLVLKDRWYGRRFLRTMYVAHPFCYHEMAITMYAVLPFRYNVLALNQPVRLYSLLQATLKNTIRITLQVHIMTSGFRTLTRLHSFAGHGQGPQWDDPELRWAVCLRNRNGVPSRVLPPHALAWLQCQERHPQKPYHLQLIVPW